MRGGRKALLLDAATTDLLFPVLGKIPGWQSDVMLINYRSVSQALHIYFMEQGQNNASATPYTYTLPANRMVYWHDFFGTALGISNGLGSIMILAVNASGSDDSQALIDGSARLFQTDAAGGTLSQMFPAVPVHDVPAGTGATAVGLRSDAQFRTNAGVVNFDSVARTFTVSHRRGVGVVVHDRRSSLLDDAGPDPQRRVLRGHRSPVHLELHELLERLRCERRQHLGRQLVGARRPAVLTRSSEEAPPLVRPAWS